MPGAADTGTPLVSVIVVAHNSAEHLGRCLAALSVQELADFEAIVVDSGSSDRGFAEARARATDPRFRFVELGANLGFAAANNRAAALARGEWLALVNPDAFAAPDWLARLIEATRRHQGADLFGSTQLRDREPDRLDGAGDAYLAVGFPWRGGYGHPVHAAATEGETFAACAAAALVRRASFIAAGGFDEAFFCFCEDVDLAFRLRLAGGRCVQVPAAVVRHVGGASAGEGSAFARYHGARNALWTFVKNMPGPLFWPLLPLHAAADCYLLLRAALRGDPGPVWRGLRDGVCDLPRVWRQRRAVQAARRAGVGAIARALSWSPRAYVAKRPVIRPACGSAARQARAR